MILRLKQDQKNNIWYYLRIANPFIRLYIDGVWKIRRVSREAPVIGRYARFLAGVIPVAKLIIK
jgi:hypothetical protein